MNHRLLTPVVRAFLVMTLLSVFVTPGRSQERNLLTTAYPSEAVRTCILPSTTWRPFPRATDRAAWEKIPGQLRKTYLEKGESALKFEWPSLPATLYLEYVRNGNRTNFQRLYYERRDKIVDLVLAECMEGRGRFLDQLANGLWLLCEETSWVIPAHIGAQRAGSGLPDKGEPVVDLFAAETGSLVAWTTYLLGDQLDKVSPRVTGRLLSELTSRILTPCLERSDFWWMWLGAAGSTRHQVNNWTPWICSNWLAAALVVERDDELRLKHVTKILLVLDQFLNSYPDDGGCDEGPSYWGRAGGSLFECLELLESASGGRISLYASPLIREIGKYLTKAYIHDSSYINFSDAPAKVTIQPDLVARYGAKIKDPALTGLGAYAAARQHVLENGVGGGLARQLQFLFSLDTWSTARPAEPLIRDVWLPQSRFMAAREQSSSANGFYLASQALHNGKSHNHNDVGNFILYANGDPCIIDVGPEAYTAKTFSSRRYEIWTMQSAYHNLPTINGVMQKDGIGFAARSVHYAASDTSAKLSSDIAGAYPPEAGVERWTREISMDRTAGIVRVRDDYMLTRSSNEIRLSLMTPCRILRSDPGIIVLRVSPESPGREASDVEIRFDKLTWTASVDPIALTDNGLKRIWGNSLNRIFLTASSAARSGSVTTEFRRTGH